MGRPRKPRPTKQQLKELLVGRTQAAVAKELGVSEQTLSVWVRNNNLSPGTRKGSQHHKSTVTEEDVALIWALKGQLSTKDAAEKFEVGRGTITDIWGQRTWGWLTATLPTPECDHCWGRNRIVISAIPVRIHQYLNRFKYEVSIVARGSHGQKVVSERSYASEKTAKEAGRKFVDTLLSRTLDNIEVVYATEHD